MFQPLFPKLLAIALIAGCALAAGSVADRPMRPATEHPIALAALFAPGIPMTAVEFEILEIGYSPFDEGFWPDPEVKVFRERREFADFLNVEVIPDWISFDQAMILAIAIGSRPTGGYQFHIDRIEAVQTPTGEHWRVHYTERVPGADCSVPQQTTTPAHFLRVREATATVELVPTQEAYHCGGQVPE